MTDYSYLSFLVIAAVIIGAIIIWWRQKPRKKGRSRQEKYRDFIMANPEKFGSRVELKKDKTRGIVDLYSLKSNKYIGIIARVGPVRAADVAAFLKERGKMRKNSRRNSRLFLVSTKIGNDMRELLDAEKLDWKEISYDG